MIFFKLNYVSIDIGVNLKKNVLVANWIRKIFSFFKKGFNDS